VPGNSTDFARCGQSALAAFFGLKVIRYGVATLD
jgi:hypothetical protein